MKRVMVVVSLVALLAVGVGGAEVDSFEDGDFTSNPEWTTTYNVDDHNFSIDDTAAIDGTYSVLTVDDGLCCGTSWLTHEFDNDLMTDGTSFHATLFDMTDGDAVPRRIYEIGGVNCKAALDTEGPFTYNVRWNNGTGWNHLSSFDRFDPITMNITVLDVSENTVKFQLYDDGSLAATETTTVGDASACTNVSVGIERGGNSNYKEANVDLVAFSPDVVPPEVDVEEPGNVTYNVRDVPLVGTANKNVTWTYSLGGASNVSAGSGTSLNTSIVGVSDGTHTLRVYGTDSFGTVDSAEVTFSVDTEGVVYVFDELAARKLGAEHELGLTGMTAIEYIVMLVIVALVLLVPVRFVVAIVKG